MANTHWVTNRGKLLLLQGDWDDDASTDLRIGLLSGASVPVGIDTEAEVQDISDVNTFLAVTSVDEPAGGWYSRKNLTRTNATQDDANNRVNMDASDVTWSAATLGDNLYGGFVYKEGASDSLRQLVSVFILAAVIPTNGSDITLTITDLFRAS